MKACAECGDPISVGFRCADCADMIEIYSSSDSVILALKWLGPLVGVSALAMAVTMVLWRMT